MSRPIAVVGAPSSIGIRPYDDGAVRRLDLAPAALREQGLVTRLGARDAGDVAPPPYRDFVRPPGRPRNEAGVAEYSRALARRIADARGTDDFVLLLGGDCSIVLGALLGVRGAGASPGLVYVDAHADFATPQESATGSPASMCLALAVGRGDSPLAQLGGDAPLVRPEHVVVVGRRDEDEPWYGQEALDAGPVLDLPHDWLRTRGAAATASAALDRVARPDVGGFWIHVDADVLDPSVVPAVDSPEPGGLELDELAALLAPLVRHPRALGMELTIYDPQLDPDRTSAARLATLLERVLGGGGGHGRATT
ncbi:MAG TPA: arginase family protein [Gemmatimonadaceae bacterium]